MASTVRLYRLPDGRFSLKRRAGPVVTGSLAPGYRIAAASNGEARVYGRSGDMTIEAAIAAGLLRLQPNH